MALKGKPIAVGTTDTDLYTCPSTIEASVHGLVFANGTGSSATITVKVYVQSTAATTTIITGQAVAANTAFTWPKPINLNAGDKIIASASTGSAIVCLYSAYEGSAAPVAVGFTPRGAWSSGASYVTNDVVSYTNGSSYLAIQASTNQQPDTQTAYWLLLAAKGDTGSGDVTGQASSVDNEIALFSGTGGKTIKRATTTGVLKASSGVIAAASAGSDFVAPGTATTFTATQTFNGSTSTLAMVLADAAETTTISATAATGTINYDVTTQSVLYYTSNASANWTVNFRASSGTSLNTLMSTGQSVTVTFLVTQGSTAYFNNAVQVDGSSVTPKYQGGTAWSAGNASSIDAYTYTIVKTGNAAFTVFAAQTRFA
jgi:hypothetical protein